MEGRVEATLVSFTSQDVADTAATKAFEVGMRTHIRGSMKTHVWQYDVGRWCFWVCAALQMLGRVI